MLLLIDKMLIVMQCQCHSVSIAAYKIKTKVAKL